MSMTKDVRAVLRLRALRLLALSSLLALFAAIVFSSGNTVRDPDIWWHLKVGDWTVEHHMVPYTGIFSRTAATRPWIAYSWGYEVLLSRCYAWFGLLGVALFGIVLTIVVAFTLFWMLHRLCGSFWVAWILLLIGSFAYLFSLMPRPVFFTMIFYTVELTLILEAQRTGRIQSLYCLIPIFVLWANVHIQFIYGLFVIGLFVGINVLQRVAGLAKRDLRFLEPPSLPLIPLLGILAACFGATFVGPYSYHVYSVVATYSRSQVPYFMIQELAAFDFNQFTHYVLLLLACTAFFVLGGRRKLSAFKLSLLVVASAIAFRTQRDAWFLGIAATIVIADYRSAEEASVPALRAPELAGVCAMVTLFVFLVASNTGFNTRNLDRTISRQYPVNAVNFLRQNPVSGPLYNTLDWGGFLIWYMPQYPVAIDGRNDLYGDELDLRLFKSEQGDSYTSDPYLNEAGVLLLPKNGPLAKLLIADTHFRIAYQDQLSVVYVRN